MTVFAFSPELRIAVPLNWCEHTQLCALYKIWESEEAATGQQIIWLTSDPVFSWKIVLSTTERKLIFFNGSSVNADLKKISW